MKLGVLRRKVRNIHYIIRLVCSSCRQHSVAFDRPTQVVDACPRTLHRSSSAPSVATAHALTRRHQPSVVKPRPLSRRTCFHPVVSLHHLYQLTQCNCELSSRLRPLSPPSEACAAYAVATAARCSSCCIYKCMSYHLLPPLGDMFCQSLDKRFRLSSLALLERRLCLSWALT